MTAHFVSILMVYGYVTMKFRTGLRLEGRVIEKLLHLTRYLYSGEVIICVCNYVGHAGSDLWQYPFRRTLPASAYPGHARLDCLRSMGRHLASVSANRGAARVFERSEFGSSAPCHEHETVA